MHYSKHYSCQELEVAYGSTNKDSNILREKMYLMGLPEFLVSCFCYQAAFYLQSCSLTTTEAANVEVANEATDVETDDVNTVNTDTVS